MTHEHEWVTVKESLGGDHEHALCRACGAIDCRRRACHMTIITVSQLAERWGVHTKGAHT